MTDILYGTNQVLTFLDCNESTLQRMRKRGKLPKSVDTGFEGVSKKHIYTKESLQPLKEEIRENKQKYNRYKQK